MAGNHCSKHKICIHLHLALLFLVLEPLIMNLKLPQEFYVYLVVIANVGSKFKIDCLFSSSSHGAFDCVSIRGETKHCMSTYTFSPL